MRIRCKDLQGSRRALGTTLGLLVTTFIQLAHGEDRLPTREELVAAFERVTRGIPSPLHLSAEVVIAGTPGTDEEIERATERNVRHLESTTGQQLSEVETEKLRELFRTSLSGTKTIHYELWRSRHGKLYRLDEYEVSLGPNATDFTSVNIWDTTFTNVPSFSASKRLGSADIQWDPKARHVELALWDAIGLEAQLAFPLIAALGTTRSDLNPSSEFERIRQSARINSDKIEQLLTDSGPDWRVLATELPDENPPQIELKFTGRVVTPENFRGKMPDKLKVTELQVSYQFEKSNFERLRKVEFSENETGMNYVSLRSNFDENGFPRRWTVQERPRQDASIQKK